MTDLPDSHDKETVFPASQDPLLWISRIATKLNTLWLTWTYPLASIGSHVSVHYSCDLERHIAPLVAIGDRVVIDRHCWFNIPVNSDSGAPVISVGDRCQIGRQCMISARNQIHLESDVVVSPSVLLMDHNHAFEDVTVPILRQGITDGGTIRIEQGCWIGFGAAIISSWGELVVGRNSVVGANSVVTRSVPANSVVAGNPARVVRQFDSEKGQWVKMSAALAEKK
jgi:acetyltransferase-like isoleucine patch superfamily enzyme